MDLFFLALMVAAGAYTLKSGYERKRIALLGSHLGQYQIEKLMESLTEGYMRALREDDPERRASIWALLTSTEAKLCEQFNNFVAGFSRVEGAAARVSRLPLPLPYADKLFPAATFDLRQVLLVHAEGITRAAKSKPEQSPKTKAFTLSAEMFLMQHSCHWFCKSKAVASARLLVRHKTSYEQVLASVAPETRRAYLALVGS
ncbi:hypothetical protein [Polaromonas sp. AET17H-212]|uniref:hypothetical protein n=1 Tax=Polaromonas sp. AET17H-212 TaxID=1977061 RepID=UPI000BBB8F3E|nr:hypothetical protein [Polaromonas sp. AET17H-212]